LIVDNPLVAPLVAKPRGRPLGFDPAAALDCAVELFWERGYEGVDVATIAARAGVTKPSLYRLFGDKRSLFVHALRHYGETIAAVPIRAFLDGRDIRDAVARLLASAAAAATQPGRPSGCLMVCVAAQYAETLPEVRALYAGGLAELERVVAGRFTLAIERGELCLHFPVAARARLLVDLTQATALRARSGASRADLETQVGCYTRLVLG